MILRMLKHLLNEPHVRAQLKVLGLTRGMASLMFLNSALESGILSALRKPMTAGELAAATGTRDRGLLQSLLDLGVSLGEIQYNNGMYSLRGVMAEALAENHPVAYMVRELVQYHGKASLHMADYLDTGEKGDYLDRMGDIIANSRRMLEMQVKLFIESTIDEMKPCRILDVGCGGGEYLRYYTEVNQHNSGIGIDRSWAAAEMARTAVRKNGITDRFTIINDDFLTTPALEGEIFDVVTSFSNIYHFSRTERTGLFIKVHGLLADKGRFLLASTFMDGSLYACYFNVIFRATRGLHPLPEIEKTLDELKQAGFTRTRVVTTIPGIPFRGIIALK